ncbi:hypothetical protein FUSO6_01455 [Fusobacterium necrophorum DAB]|uniref:hypothetical protein n=1 Tax=Fusobacterium necrophorum TaxID=859 RepID=UPI0004617434|nr:hypothetical protein [Fusobacterium necrophorum]KDE71257.1 hypothetical protein FUSO6_01455 [Fusobacterium necrophorum DAB]
MDTISFKLEFITEGVNTWEELEQIKRTINSLQSNNGHTYVDVLEANATGIIVKLSYPRYFAGINAYLITSISECQEVQRYFIEQLEMWGIVGYFKGISLLRVDIPFTYFMDEEIFFYCHENVFRIFAWIYHRHFTKSSPKAISEILTKRQETLYYTDSKVIGNYNSRVMVYNQALNIQEKTEDEEIYQGIIEQFPDLSRRIRLEVSKRIKRQSMSLEEFQGENLYAHYFSRYKNYLLENLLNLEDLELYYEETAIAISQKLLLFREEMGSNFTYEAFLLQNIGIIWDYEVIRRALKKIEMNPHTRENPITRIRKILKQWEENNQVLILDIYRIFLEIRNQIEFLSPNLKRLDKFNFLAYTS